MGKIFEIEESEGEIIIRIKRPKILPEETRTHLQAAVREGLLAFRSLIDDFVARLEKIEPKAESRKRTEIKIE